MAYCMQAASEDMTFLQKIWVEIVAALILCM